MTHPSTDPRSLPADVKRKLLAARDALTEGDAMEAYHQIYSIASPHFDKLADEVWTGLESPSPEPREICPACEGWPKDLNTPCAVCGLDARAVEPRENYESGWVIEGAWSPADQPEYWVGSSAWSTDAYKALRFANRHSAQQAADLMCSGMNVRICEHEWAVSPETKEAK